MPWLPKKCVVVPIDFSDDSIAAVATGMQLTAHPADLHVLHVLPNVEPSDPEYLWTTAEPAAREEHALQALRERLSATPGVQLHVTFGEAGHGIADFAQSIGAELIVLPSHGRTGLSRLLIGSTAERVVRLAHCPVLVLRK